MDTMDEELDLSWIEQEETVLEQSRDISVKPLECIPIVACYVENGQIVHKQEITSVAPLEKTETTSVLSSEKIVHFIQQGKNNGRPEGKWHYAHGAVFHIDVVDIQHLYKFSSCSFLTPLDFYKELVLPCSPVLFHSFSQLFLFFEKRDHSAGVVVPPKSILKKNAKDAIAAERVTKRVRICAVATERPPLPSSVSSSLANKKRKTRRT